MRSLASSTSVDTPIGRRENVSRNRSSVYSVDRDGSRAAQHRDPQEDGDGSRNAGQAMVRQRHHRDARGCFDRSTEHDALRSEQGYLSRANLGSLITLRIECLSALAVAHPLAPARWRQKQERTATRTPTPRPKTHASPHTDAFEPRALQHLLHVVDLIGDIAFFLIPPGRGRLSSGRRWHRIFRTVTIVRLWSHRCRPSALHI